MSASHSMEYAGGAGLPAHAGHAVHPHLHLPRSAWIKIGVLTTLVCAVFWPNLVRLWGKTNPFYGEPNWGHSMCIPVIGLYYLYVNRDALLAAPRRTSWLGFGIAIFGLLLFGYGIWPGQNDFVKDFGMVVTLFGIVAMLCGWAVMKIAWFPIVFLICGIPWPGLVYSKVAGPLQQLAAGVAVDVLQFTGVKSFATGTKICVYGHGDVMRTLNVAEACAGLRSLMTFISVAAAVAFLSNRMLWQKLLLVASAVPIAISCNVMRVSGQGLLDHYVSQQLSENFAHQFVGMVMLVPAFVLILAVGWLLDQVFIEESNDVAVKVLRRGQTHVVAGGAALNAVVGNVKTQAATDRVQPVGTVQAVPVSSRSPLRMQPARKAAPLKKDGRAGNKGDGSKA